MNKYSEINFISTGNADDVNFWSGVPYYFSHALMKRGFRVNYINVEVLHNLDKLINKGIRLIRKNTVYSFRSSKLYNFFVKREMKKQILKYPEADLNITIGYNFSPASVSSLPSIMLGDFTYAYRVNKRMNRHPRRFEKLAISRQHDEMKKSDIIITLFPDTKKDIEELCDNLNIYCLGNVVNVFSSEEYTDEQLEYKFAGNKVLFVGRKWYRDGATLLIKALDKLLQRLDKTISLDIVGMNEGDFDMSLPKWVKCHGYLSKSDYDQNKIYLKLLKEAKVFANPTPKWGGYSSIVEAMMNYTPIIVSPFEDFISLFGESIDFGYYCEEDVENRVEHLERLIENIFSLELDEYKSMCKSSYNQVKDCTWESYVERFVSLIERM